MSWSNVVLGMVEDPVAVAVLLIGACLFVVAVLRLMTPARQRFSVAVLDAECVVVVAVAVIVVAQEYVVDSLVETQVPVPIEPRAKPLGLAP